MRLCRQCGRPLTAQQARQALARMIEAGLTVQEARSKSPRCFHCARQVGTASCTEEPVKQEMSYATNR
jgi:hypothetical protein